MSVIDTELYERIVNVIVGVVNDDPTVNRKELIGMVIGNIAGLEDPRDSQALQIKVLRAVNQRASTPMKYRY